MILKSLSNYVENSMAQDIQWWFSSARVDVGGGSHVVVYEVSNPIYSEPHLPTFWKWLLVQQSEKQERLYYISEYVEIQIQHKCMLNVFNIWLKL